MAKRVGVLSSFVAFNLFAVALVLIACGGSSYNGGGIGGGGSYAGQAQGVYSGTSSNGYTFESIILPNDKVYALYGSVSGTSFLVDGMMTGQGSSSNDTYTASVTDFFNTGAINAASLNATDVPGSSINGTIMENGTSTTFSGTALPNSSFNYNTAASVSSVSGSWNGSLLDGSSATITINSDGTFSGSSSGCSFSGTLSADSSNKNFFDVSLTFGASCLSANQTATGIGVYYLLSDGVTHQLVAAVTIGTSFGTVFFAQR